MKKVTTGDLARALQGIYPISIDTVLGWAQCGLLPAWQRPTNTGRGWYFIQPKALPVFLKKHLELSPEEINQVFQRLGLKQEVA